LHIYWAIKKIGDHYVPSTVKGIKAQKDNSNEEVDADVYKIVYSDNACYEGEMQDGKAHGEGTYVFLNGDKYEGSFENDLPKGSGMIYKRERGGYRCKTTFNGTTTDQFPKTIKDIKLTHGKPLTIIYDKYRCRFVGYYSNSR